MSNLETETLATDDTVTFEHFDRTWTVPARRHHKHLVQIKRIIRTEGGVDADDIALVYLSGEEYDQLVELNVDLPRLREFADAVAAAMGVGDVGNL